MSNECEDLDYTDNHDYLKSIEKFKRKDMLLLSLHQEWVKRRYTVPVFYKSLGITLVGMAIASLAFAYKLLKDDELLVGGLMLTNTVIMSILTLYSFWKQRKEEKSEIIKLNAIRQAINKLL